MILKGKKTYLASVAGVVLGVAAYLDPAAAKVVADALGIDIAMVLCFCGLAGAILRKLTAMEK